MESMLLYANVETGVLYVSKGKYFAYLSFNELCTGKPKLPLGLIQSVTPAEAELLRAKVNQFSPLGASKAMVDATSDLVRLAKSLPGVNAHVRYPCNCQADSDALSDVIIHLNDEHHEWDRFRIADWVETLDVDTEFKDSNAVG